MNSFVRIYHIIGDAKRGILPIYPVSRATWYAGIKAGKYPKPIRLSEGVSVWLLSDVQKLVDDVVNASTH